MSQSGLDKPLQNRTEAEYRASRRMSVAASEALTTMARAGGMLKAIGEFEQFSGTDFGKSATEMAANVDYGWKILLAELAKALEPSRATLDGHCLHPADNLNADKTRCLSCGVWL